MTGLRILFLTVSVFGLCLPAGAQTLSLLDTSIDVTLFDAKEKLPLSISATPPGEGETSLRIQAEARLSDVLPRAARAMERAVAANHRGCEERWSAWGGDLGVAGAPGADGVLNARLTVRVEKWVCKIVKTRLARETATLYATVQPRVANGQLSLALTRFDMSGLGAISKAFGVERKVRAALQREIQKINASPDFQKPPPEFSEAGFSYDFAGIGQRSGAGPVLQVGVAGPNDTTALLRIIAALAARLAPTQ